MTGLDPNEWREYFVASIGAGAALAGLVFVAISINLREILRYPGLVGRSAEALILLLSLVFVGLVGVAPSPSASVTGLEIALVAGVIWAVVGWILIGQVRGIQDRAEQVTRGQVVARILMTQLATIPAIVGGLSLALGVGFGLQWLVVGAIFALAAGVLDAWVLLIEILR